MDATSSMARARVVAARARDALSGVGGSPAELAALAALALAVLALLAVLWARTPGAETAETAEMASMVDPPAGPARARHGLELEQDGHPEDDLAVGSGAAEIVVHVAGAVRAPGLYEVSVGARVADAVDAAGGATGDAALDHLNLAREVSDGEQLLVPDEGSLDAGPGDGRRPDGKLDLNRATADELEALPGVGPVTAERIIDHREANGPFADPRDLISVPGIGERTMETLADHIGV